MVLAKTRANKTMANNLPLHIEESVKILTVSNYELQSFIEEKLAINAALGIEGNVPFEKKAFVPNIIVERKHILKIIIPRVYIKQGSLEKEQRQVYWIIEAISQRYRILHKIAKEILDQENDLSDLEPIDTQGLANKLFLSPLTINRAISGKYLKVNNKVFPLRVYVKSSNRYCVECKINEKIKKVIDQENKIFPLSDLEIQAALEKEGVTKDVRTITRYRKNMGILSSKKRKKC